MFKVYSSEMLANLLCDIAIGNAYSSGALIAAKQHPVATYNDKQMVNRWLCGNWTAADAFELQQLAIYIRESKQDVKA